MDREDIAVGKKRIAAGRNLHAIRPGARPAVQNDPDLLFRRLLFAHRAADVFYDLLTVALLGSGFLSHLHSLAATMSQKPSLIKST
ncbi:hypothetical protein [Ruegeria conchae]|uniref:hypothetical protein n=1 Tax=Ruegeria conchae TaxID=981384 RepID=UPI0029C90191|nr:hypothetical protein [Ruegeria conchae]